MSVRARQTRSRGSGAARLALLLGAPLALMSAHCTFPEYDLRASGGSGAADSSAGSASAESGRAGAMANGGAAGRAGQPGLELGGAAGVGPSPDPECAPEQWAVRRCEDTCLRRLPDHCYDGGLSGDETDVDCGGSCQGCTSGRCETELDCLSGACVAGGPDPKACGPALTLTYTPHELAASVATTAWSVTLSNPEQAGGAAYSFRDLKVRYYFERSGVTEPILTNNTQSNLQLANGEARAVAAQWTIAREEDVPEQTYDAYVELGFTEVGQLFPGDRLELYQQLFAGDPASSNFDQRANYSFEPTAGASLRITVLYQGKLIWGLEPRPNHPRACFARAVNVNGPELTVSGNSWQSATDARIATTGSGMNQRTVLFPAATGSLAKALETSTRLNADQQLVLPVENDTYLVYLYAISPGSAAATAHFTLQGEEPESSGGFRAQAASGGQAWAKLGPYRVDVSDGELVLGVSAGSSSLNVAALELWYPE